MMIQHNTNTVLGCSCHPTTLHTGALRPPDLHCLLVWHLVAHSKLEIITDMALLPLSSGTTGIPKCKRKSIVDALYLLTLLQASATQVAEHFLIRRKSKS